MLNRYISSLSAALLGLTALAGAASAQTPPASVDYGDKANWLCLPGRTDQCASDNSATIISADGNLKVETWAADPKAPIDCFYVYPTVSNDPGTTSDMIPNDEERRVVEQQLSRFASRCRVYAPMYRQFTLTALRATMTGAAPAGAASAFRIGPQDVSDAWNWYLKNENKGRGVVLIGHSQGSGVLTGLIANEIDGKPSQKLLVSAMLLGTNLPVEKGQATGLFKSISLCASPDQFGCAIAYATFRDTVPPPANTRFGRPRDPASPMEAACVNPAALGGGKGALHAYLSTAGNGQDPAAWVKDGGKIATPFVSVPGLLSAECVRANGFNYLSIHVNSDPADPRIDNVRGDITPDWGLHLIDVNLAMGNLVDLAGSQGKAWLAAKRP